VILALIFLSVAIAIQWRGYDNSGTAVVRVAKVIAQPPLFPYSYDVLAAERDLRPKATVIISLSFFLLLNFCR
jgi:hypothetical protein